MKAPRTRRPEPPAPSQELAEKARDYLVGKGHRAPVVAITTPTCRYVAGDAELRWEIGSITKIFTATLLARLAEQGVVSLSDPVSRWLPVGIPVEPEVGAITLEQLSSHLSGLPRLPPGMYFRALGRHAMDDPYAKIDETHLLGAMTRTHLRRFPGKPRMSYSNFGVGLLGYLLGRATATGYQAALISEVVEPLGLVATDFSDRDLKQGYAKGAPVAPWHMAEFAGAGGLRAPAVDLLTLVEALRDGGTPLDGALAETIEARQRPTKFGPGVGLGWMLMRNGEVILHNGGTHGARSEVWFERASGTGVVVLGDGKGGADKAAAMVIRPR
ncbi:MAG: serine hydrolase domain-containing protein [Candidatus Nanopelagicales bacterium]